MYLFTFPFLSFIFLLVTTRQIKVCSRAILSCLLVFLSFTSNVFLGLKISILEFLRINCHMFILKNSVQWNLFSNYYSHNSLSFKKICCIKLACFSCIHILQKWMLNSCGIINDQIDLKSFKSDGTLHPLFYMLINKN